MSENERTDFLLCVYDGSDGKVKVWTAQPDGTPTEGVLIPDGARWIRVTKVRGTDVVVDRTELAALRDLARGPRIDEVPPVTHASTEAFTAAPPVSHVVKVAPAPRPFKVGDRVRLLPSAKERGAGRCVGEIGEIDFNDNSDLPFRVDLSKRGHVWVRPSDIEHAPAPAPEATAALGGAITQKMVPESWLDDAVKRHAEWMARAEKAERLLEQAISEVGEAHRETKATAAALCDERARFERETAARLLAIEWQDDLHKPLPKNVTRGEYWSIRAKYSAIAVKALADYYFSAKERGK